MAYDRNDRRTSRYGSNYPGERSERDYDRGYDRYGSGYDRYGSSGNDRRYNRDDYRARSGNAGGWRNDRPPSDYDYEDRSFFERAGDEVRSWFGDEEAERRREWDERYADREYSGYAGTGHGVAGRSSYGWSTPDYGAGRGAGATGSWGLGAGRDRQMWAQDPSYRAWRSRQMAALDNEYADYMQENQSRFDSEFGTWRTRRQSQRDTLNSVQEHQEVVGSDGQHVGKVDKVRGDRIILTKTDKDAEGHHHSIPCSWIESIDDGKVRINRTADQAQKAWKDEERNAFGWNDEDRGGGYAGNYRRSYTGS